MRNDLRDVEVFLDKRLWDKHTNNSFELRSGTGEADKMMHCASRKAQNMPYALMKRKL